MPKYIHRHNPAWNKGLKLPPLSEEHRKKISKKLKGRGGWIKGRKHTKATRHKMSIARKGRKHTEETKQKISLINKGRKRTKESKDKMSKSHTGMKLSEITKKKLSENNKGQIPWIKGKTGYWAGKTRSDITRKKISLNRRGKCTGKTNQNWNGGSSYKPYCIKFNTVLKEKIRERDKRTCQLCGVKEDGRKLDVHHIHYDKENCYPDLITLCYKCNIKVNKNKTYYETFFMNNLNERRLLFWGRNKQSTEEGLFNEI